MSVKPQGFPFKKNIEHLKTLFGLDNKEAIDRVQDSYAKFKDRNQKLTERQTDQSNIAQVQLISHFAILATLSLTVIGFFITQTAQVLTGNQEITILLIVICNIISLCFGAYDYIQTINFHRNWAELYQSIDLEVDKRFAASELQWTNELNEIENEKLAFAPKSTLMWITYAMVVSCLAGLLLSALLVFAFFNDIPGVR